MVDERNDLVIRGEQQDFKVRVSGILLDESGRVAVNVDRYEEFVSLPGGKVKFGETSQQAVVREFSEEMGLSVSATRLIAVVENQFSYRGKLSQGIEFYWLVEIIATEKFARDGLEQAVVWRGTTDLEDLKPAVLRAILSDLPMTTLHLENKHG